LFYEFYSFDKNDNLLLQILESIGYHTLTVELLSKMAFKRGISLQKLLDSIITGGISEATEAKVITKHDRSRTPSLPFEYLSQIFDISDLSENNKRLLMNISAFGGISLTYEQLENLIEADFSNKQLFHNLTELHELGWVTKRNNSFVLHQLVCEVLKSKLQPNFGSCKTLINNVHEYLEKNTNEFDGYIQKIYIEIALQLLRNKIVDKKLISNFRMLIARFHGNMGSLEKYNEWFSQLDLNKIEIDMKHSVMVNHGNILLVYGKCSEAINVLKECRNYYNDKTILAQIDITLAQAYSLLGDFEEAQNIFIEAYKVLEKDEDLSKSEFSVSVNNYSIILSGLGKHEEALSYSLKAMELREDSLVGTHPLLAQSYNNVGVSYESLDNLEKAYFYHLRALKIRKEFEDENNADLAETYHNIASVFTRTNKNEATEFYEKAITIREIAYIDGHPSLVMSYFCYAAFLIESNIQKSLNVFKKAFDLANEFDFDNNQNMPNWMMGYSIALFENRDYKTSLKFINKSIVLYQKYGENEGCMRAMNFKARIERMSPIKNKPKIGRNAPCPCGSGLKHKKCCG